MKGGSCVHLFLLEDFGRTDIRVVDDCLSSLVREQVKRSVLTVKPHWELEPGLASDLLDVFADTWLRSQARHHTILNSGIRYLLPLLQNVARWRAMPIKCATVDSGTLLGQKAYKHIYSISFGEECAPVRLGELLRNKKMTTDVGGAPGTDLLASALLGTARMGVDYDREIVDLGCAGLRASDTTMVSYDTLLSMLTTFVETATEFIASGDYHGGLRIGETARVYMEVAEPTAEIRRGDKVAYELVRSVLEQQIRYCRAQSKD